MKSVYDRGTTTFREVDINLLDEPSEDLRFFRSHKFEDVLFNDLRKEGSVVPVVVRRKPNTDRFVIVDGVSRVRRLRELGVRMVWCQIVDCSDEDAIVIGLKLNIFRRSHDPLGLAKAFKVLHDKHGVKYVDIAKRFGYTRSWVTKLVALNDLVPEYKEMVARGDMTIEDGYAIARGGDVARIMKHAPERGKVRCDVCGRDSDVGLVQSVRVCFECGSDLDRIRSKREAQIKRELERARRLKRRGQKRLVDQQSL